MRGSSGSALKHFLCFYNAPCPIHFTFFVKWVGNEDVDEHYTIFENALSQARHLTYLLSPLPGRAGPPPTFRALTARGCSVSGPWCRVTMIAPAGFRPAHR